MALAVFRPIDRWWSYLVPGQARRLHQKLCVVDGEVAFVDAHDDGHGRFRVVVVPTAAEPWPDAAVLRQGVRANGWVLLDRVSAGFEIWRRLNAFPPSLDSAPYGSGDDREAA